MLRHSAARVHVDQCPLLGDFESGLLRPAHRMPSTLPGSWRSDAAARRGLETMVDIGQAREDLEFCTEAPGERAWWRVALIDGEPVGFDRAGYRVTEVRMVMEAPR